LRLSGLAFCVLGCFFGSAFEAFWGLGLLFGRVATFHVDSMLAALSVSGALALWAAGSVLLGLGFPNFHTHDSLNWCPANSHL
jgi:hypothetical protein